MNGNTFVAFGAAAQVTEVTANGDVMWEAQLTNNGMKVPFLQSQTVRIAVSIRGAMAPRIVSSSNEWFGRRST